MASTFGGLMSLSRRNIWLQNFTRVEQMIGKDEIGLGKDIINENLQAEIDASPINRERSKAMLSLMMDGGWYQRASGHAYISQSRLVVPVGPRSHKVCARVYTSTM